jgi:hypothetical protein
LVWRRTETLQIPSIVRILLRSARWWRARRVRAEERAAADLLIVPPMDKSTCSTGPASTAIDGLQRTMEALDKARSLPIGARISSP